MPKPNGTTKLGVYFSEILLDSSQHKNYEYQTFIIFYHT